MGRSLKIVELSIEDSTIRLSDHLKDVMSDKTREFTLCHNVQRQLGQSEDWVFCIAGNVWLKNTIAKILYVSDNYRKQDKS